MKHLNQLLPELEQQLIEVQLPILNKLQEGLTSKVASKLLKQVGISNDGLVTLYGWKNGIKDMSEGINIEYLEVFPEAIMLSLEDALNHYRISVNQKLFSEGLFPTFTNGGGDYYLLDCNKNSKTNEMILLFAPSLLLEEDPQSIYDSIESLVYTVICCYKQGGYKINNSGTLDVDYDIKYQLSAKLNPRSSYWHDYR